MLLFLLLLAFVLFLAISWNYIGSPFQCPKCSADKRAEELFSARDKEQRRRTIKRKDVQASMSDSDDGDISN